MIDRSIYKKNHDKVIDFIREQIGVDLNDYRDGNGTDPYTTTYWDINGPKVCVNWKMMDRIVKNKIRHFTSHTKEMILEQGGSWFYYISFAE